MNETLSQQEIAKQYVNASVHYGHSPKEWNPKMAPYILYAKYGYHDDFSTTCIEKQKSSLKSQWATQRLVTLA